MFINIMLCIATRMKRSWRELTHGERILLHISEFEYDEEGYHAPYNLCQDGISEALGILKNNVSREIGKLKKKGMIKEMISRVKGAQRRRKIYRPTSKGERVCKDIKKELEKNKFNIKEDHRIVSITVGDAVKRLKKDIPEIDPFHVTEWMRTRDVMDPKEFTLYYRAAKKDGRMVESMAEAPVVKSFYGRKDEFTSILEMLSGEDPPIIVITGILGIGKSTLAARITDELKGKNSLFWHTFHSWKSQELLVGELKNFLKKASGTVNEESMYGILVEVLDNVTDPVFFLDNCEKASEDMSRVFGMLLELNKRKGGFGTVLMSRKRLSFYDVRDIMNQDVVEIEIGPLDERDVENMTEGMEISSMDVYQKTRGHPLYVEIYKRFQGKTESMDEFIGREMYSALDDSEKNLMKKLAVILNPCEREIVLDKDEENTLLKLKSSHFVEETREGKLSLHPLLKDHIYSRLSMIERNELHARTGSAMIKKRKIPDLETLYHLEKGGCWKEALESLSLLKDTVAHLHEEHRGELMEMFPEDLVPQEHLPKYYELKGDIHMEAGEWEGAVENYKRILDTGSNYPSAVMEKIGEAHRNLRRWKEALKTHKKTLDAYRESGDKEGMVRELLALGTVYRKKDELHKAENHYEKARKIIKEEKIKDAMGAYYNNIGLLHVHKSEFASAEEYFKKALEHGELGIVYENLAELYRKMGEHSKALVSLESALEQYIDTARWREVSRLYLTLGEAHAVTGRRKKAINTFNKGLTNEKDHRKKKLFRKNTSLSRLEIELHRNLADSLRGYNWKECLRHRKIVIDALETRNHEDEVHRAKLEFVFDLRDSGDSEKALKELKSLEEYLQDEKQGVLACKLEMGRIYRDIGRYKDAFHVAKDGLKLAKEIGEESGISTAKEMIRDLRRMKM